MVVAKFAHFVQTWQPPLTQWVQTYTKSIFATGLHKANFVQIRFFIQCSFDSVETAKETRRQLSEMGEKAGFHICKWLSNHTEVLEDIPEHDRSSDVILETNVLPTTKTLRMRWNPVDDKFLFDYYSRNDEFQFTKRNVLKKTASLFDSLGLIAPFVVKAKFYLQQAWLESLDWDDELPYDTVDCLKDKVITFNSYKHTKIGTDGSSDWGTLSQTSFYSVRNSNKRCNSLGG